MALRPGRPGLTGTPAPLGVPVAGAATWARFRWSSAGGITAEIRLDPARSGPLIVPAPGWGARLTATLLDALDQSAREDAPRVRLSAEGSAFFFDRPADWPHTMELPSLAIGGGQAGPVSIFPAAQIERARDVERLRQVLAEDDVAAMKLYPVRRRSLAATRRRLELDLRYENDRLSQRQRLTRLLVVAALTGLGGAFAATSLHRPTLVVASTCVFLGAAAGLVAVGARLPQRMERKRDLEQRLSVAHAELGRLDRQATDCAQRAGYEDVWRLAAEFVAPIDAPGEAGTASDAAAPRRHEIVALAHALAGELGVPIAAVDAPSAWRPADRSLPGGWPAEVRSLTGAHAEAQMIVAAATLLDRVMRLTPSPWPLVMWEPWPGDEPEVRAARLMALSHVATGRPVVAIVEGRP